ncbi:MAG: DeoR/GlpR family DNA-binding transcription regulator [Pseudomonadota bacterium]
MNRHRAGSDGQRVRARTGRDAKRASGAGPKAQSSAGRLLASARQARIAEIVGQTGFISVIEAAGKLGVSGMTVRRDLEVLESRGLLVRTHGGAVATAPDRREVYDAEEPAFERRRRRNATAKAEIAKAAARLVGANETIALDVGTSTLALAEELTARADLRVFTNNLRAAMALSRGRSSVYILGGQLRGPEFAVVGSVATAQVKDYYFDRLFLGVSGITETGLYDYMLEDTEVKRAFLERARQVVVLCDSSKFDHRALARICGLEQAHVLVTDKVPPPHLLRTLEDHRIEIIVTES